MQDSNDNGGCTQEGLSFMGWSSRCKDVATRNSDYNACYPGGCEVARHTAQRKGVGGSTAQDKYFRLANMLNQEAPPHHQSKGVDRLLKASLLLLVVFYVAWHGSRDRLRGISSLTPKPAVPVVRHPDFWLPPAWIGTPPPLNPLACTPQLLIVAAPKAGTTAVYDYLNGTVAGYTVRSEAVHFLNGTQASQQYLRDFQSLPEEQRRFHPRLAGSFHKEMHIFDGDISRIPGRLKQFPGINATLDNPLAGVCSYEAAAFGLATPAAGAVRRQAQGQDDAADGGSVAAGSTGNTARSSTGAALYSMNLSSNSSSGSSSISTSEASTPDPTSSNIAAGSAAGAQSAAKGSGAPAAPVLVRFEATPAYLHTALAATQLEELLPQARHLVLLREPVSRAISHFNMRIQGQSLLEAVAPAEYSSGWADYIASQVERQASSIAKCKARVSGRSPVPAYTQLDSCLFSITTSKDTNQYDLYKGMYDLHLDRWFHHFSPNQTLIWSSRAFSLNPKQHLEQLVVWLGLDPAEINHNIDFVKVHERGYPDDRPMPAWLYQQLVEFYEPHKQATLLLLQRVGYVRLSEQLAVAWEEELAHTKETLVRAAARR